MTNIELPARKQVGHLTLLRETRPLTPREFNALSPDERLTMISRAQGRQKYRLLLEAADVDQLLPRLAPQELYLLIREQGFEEMAELLPLVSAEQFGLLVDLDCWEGDQLVAGETVKWLQMLLDCGDEKVLETLQDLDFELLVLILKKHLRVVSGPEDLNDDDARAEAQRRDGGYQIEYLDSENGKLVGQLLNLLMRRDLEFFRELVEAVRWEQEAMLEENVYNQHRGRLEDCGFPDPAAARGIYAWLPREQLEAGDKSRHPMTPALGRVAQPGFFLTAARPRDLLAEVLATGVDERSAWELAYLVNKLMIADRVDVGDQQQVQSAAGRVFRYLNLALEELAGDDVTLAAEPFARHYLEHLFRFGFSLTLQLQRMARELTNRAPAVYCDSADRVLLSALLQRQPLYLADPAEEPTGGERPFATRRDLQRCAARLAALEVQLRLFERHFGWALPAPDDFELDGCLPATGAELTLSTLFLTALANRLLGGEFLPIPIPAGRLAELHDRVTVDGKVAPALRVETAAWLEGLEAGAGAFGQRCLDRWEEEFCPLAPDDLDPRFIGGLIVRLAAD